jgi:hypothetical protein
MLPSEQASLHCAHLTVLTPVDFFLLYLLCHINVIVVSIEQRWFDQPVALALVSYNHLAYWKSLGLGGKKNGHENRN